MYRYIHGSEDSTDIDVMYTFDELPDFNTCKIFCHTNPDENRNMIVVHNGQVVDCFIGTIDEINNALIDTYPLHPQDFPLIVTKRYERNITMKQIRAVRGILSILSRTIYRPIIKKALRTNWSDRLACLNALDLTKINFDDLNKQKDKQDMLKVIAFQIGQAVALLDGIELYTKRTIADQYPSLEQFLYRHENINIGNLQEMLIIYLNKLKEIRYQEEGNDIVYFPDYNMKYELRHETIL